MKMMILVKKDSISTELWLNSSPEEICTQRGVYFFFLASRINEANMAINNILGLWKIFMNDS